MPIKSISSSTTSITIDYGFGPVEALYLSHGGQPGSNNHRDSLMDSLNALLETRINRDDLPVDEEVLNPSQWSDAEMTAAFGERMFWDRNGPNWFLVSRAVIVSELVWNGEKYIPTVRRAV